ncbi:transcription factor MYB1-like [Punica granatum]|uniref:Uncharacterized protein n=2 Tax=Punica granatum TaxID=22663 RepID=A0A218WH59_PUNGR|nr:transcription factor MYB1-like [Punica granatum]OWM72184.1 hypothetical protein CDL15_Pgr018068 [Punica granatum]PKI63634.1 hypothetical protein CRG98_015971 [Punica granatum]
MGRAPCCSKVGLHKGPWSTKEDAVLINYIQQHGEGHWRSLPKKAGLLRCGKSCRLRWMNYLRPDIKRGNITPDEEDLIIRMHSLLGNRWSLIARMLPGRTDNEIKNYWNSHLSKRVNNKSTGTKPKPSGNNKPARGPKKRNNSIGATSEVAKSRKKQKVKVGMIKVHQPKAVRVSPYSITRNNSSDGGPSGLSSSILGAKGGLSETMNYGAVQSVLDDDDQIYHEDYYCDIIEEGDRSHSSCNLEKIFEEYQQLLKGDDNVQLDSFADSLLI